ncbi:MAG: hypothetical protein RLZZ337_1349 [Bacteroidota bacterium]|jgi:hypothetical protein
MILLLGSCSLFKSTPKYDKLQVNDNYQLNYNLASDGERYQFIVDIVDLEPYFKYQFTMTNNNQTSALHTFTPHALEYAFAQKVKFGPSSDTLKDHIVTGMFSRKSYRELLAGDTVAIVPDASMMSDVGIFYNDGFEAYMYELNGEPQTIEVMRVMEIADGTPRNYLILNNEQQPLIIKMDIGWAISLKEINYVTK